MLIYLDQYRTESANSNMLKNGTYGDEMMSASCQPKVIRLPHPTSMALTAVATLPEDLTTADVDALLGEVYALATQI
jgi:hypothetical protein